VSTPKDVATTNVKEGRFMVEEFPVIPSSTVNEAVVGAGVDEVEELS